MPNVFKVFSSQTIDGTTTTARSLPVDVQCQPFTCQYRGSSASSANIALTLWGTNDSSLKDDTSSDTGFVQLSWIASGATTTSLSITTDGTDTINKTFPNMRYIRAKLVRTGGSQVYDVFISWQDDIDKV